MFMRINRINMHVKFTTNRRYDPYRSVQDLILRAIWAINALITFSVAIQKPQRIAILKRLVTFTPTVLSPIIGMSE